MIQNNTFGVRRPLLLAGISGVLVVGASLGGCSKSWSVEVHNMTDQPLQTEVLIYEPGVASPHVVESKQIGPADKWESGRLGSSSMSRAEIEIDFAGNVGGSVVHPLKRGRTTLEVRRPAGEGSRGRLEVLEVQ